MKKKIILPALAAAACAVAFASVPQLTIKIGGNDVKLLPGEQITFGAADGIADGAETMVINGKTVTLSDNATVEFRSETDACRVNGNELTDGAYKMLHASVALEKGAPVVLDGMGRVKGILPATTFRFAESDPDKAIFHGATGNYDFYYSPAVNRAYAFPVREAISVDGNQPDAGLYDRETNTKTLTLTNGQKVEFKGIADLYNALEPHFWDVTDATHATFKGRDGQYDLIWSDGNYYIFTEYNDKTFPASLYIGGLHLGQFSNGYAPSIWSWGNPGDMITFNQVSDNKYEATLYLGSDFRFKLSKSYRTMGAHGDVEIWATDFTINQPELLGGDATWGDFMPGTNFTPGAYTIVADLEAKTFNITKYEPSHLPAIDGVAMSRTDYNYYVLRDKQLTPNQTVTFSNIEDLNRTLQPDAWNVADDGTVTFIGAEGTYDIYLDPVNMVLYAEATNLYDSDNGEVAWICGINFSHPGAAPAITSDGWDIYSPYKHAQMRKVENNVYEVTLWLPENFCVKTYRKRNWDSEAAAKVVTPYPANMLTGSAEWGDLLPGEDFIPGVYTIRVDYNRNIVYFVGFYNPE